MSTKSVGGLRKRWDRSRVKWVLLVAVMLVLASVGARRVQALAGSPLAMSPGATSAYSLNADSIEPALFNKLGPASGLSGLERNVQLTWGRAAQADYYQICVDTTNNDRCDTPWRPGAQATVLTLENLRAGTYYWQVRAMVNGRLTEADDGRWWTFTVGGGSVAKLAPAPGTSGLGRNVQLTWGRLPGADYYQICVDTTNDDRCDTPWRPGAQATVLTLENLRTGTYYWQIRAMLNGNLIEADGGRWWSFTVGR
jgi:hypothetical protein